MYIETRSKTIAEATDKLYDLKPCDLVFGCPPEALTDAQKEVLDDFLNTLDYALDDASEDRKLAIENLYVNLTDDHIYVLEMEDDHYEDTVMYHYTELVPIITIYKDADGNLWNYIDYDVDDKTHKMTVVEEDDGHYTDTGITWYMTQAEFNQLAKIEVEV